MDQCWLFEIEQVSYAFAHVETKVEVSLLQWWGECLEAGEKAGPVQATAAVLEETVQLFGGHVGYGAERDIVFVGRHQSSCCGCSGVRVLLGADQFVWGGGHLTLVWCSRGDGGGGV